MNFALLSDRPSTMKQSRERFILISSHNQERREENYQITGNQKNDSEALVGATPFMSRSWTSMEPRMESAIDEIERQQSAVGKFNLGLPLNAPNISASSILGIKPFRELLYTAQLKYLLRLFNQDSRRVMDQNGAKVAIKEYLKRGAGFSALADMWLYTWGRR